MERHKSVTTINTDGRKTMSTTHDLPSPIPPRATTACPGGRQHRRKGEKSRTFHTQTRLLARSMVSEPKREQKMKGERRGREGKGAGGQRGGLEEWERLKKINEKWGMGRVKRRGWRTWGGESMLGTGDRYGFWVLVLL